jgi:hypothetical protein
MITFPEGLDLQKALIVNGESGLCLVTVKSNESGDVIISAFSYWPDEREAPSSKEIRHSMEAKERLNWVSSVNVFDTRTNTWGSKVVDIEDLLSQYHHWATHSIKLRGNLIRRRSYGKLGFLMRPKLSWATRYVRAWLDALAVSGYLVKKKATDSRKRATC